MIFRAFLLYSIKFALFLKLFKDGSLWFSHEELIDYLFWLPLTCMLMKMPKCQTSATLFYQPNTLSNIFERLHLVPRVAERRRTTPRHS